MNRHHVSLRALTLTGLLITAALLSNGQTDSLAGDPEVDFTTDSAF